MPPNITETYHSALQELHATKLRQNIESYITSLGMQPSKKRKSMTDAQQPTTIWLDCDTGHDDALAILLAARTPDVRLLGISTVYGNASLDHTTYNTRAILKAIARTDVPVYAGASRPQLRETCYAPGIHGQSGLDGTASLPQPTVQARSDMSAVNAMYRTLRNEPKGTAWLVATGALTNIAELFASYPELVDHIAGLSIMGGAIGDSFTSAPMGKLKGEGDRFGNHTPFAEFNIYCDPDAAEALFSNPALAKKTTLIPLDLTHQFLATSEVQIGLLGFGMRVRGEPTMETVSTVRRLFFEIVTYFARTYADIFGLTAGPPTHDPLAVAATFKPELFYCNATDTPGRKDPHSQERFTVQVTTSGEHGVDANNTSQCGRTVATLLPPGEPGITIPRGLEAKQLWALLESCLGRAELAISKTAATERKDSSDALKPPHSQQKPTMTRFGSDMSMSTASAGNLPSAGASERRSPYDGGGQRRKGDMTTLVDTPETTLSEFEMAAGTFPDIKSVGSLDQGTYINTNKVENLGLEPVDPGSEREGYSDR